ncbi:hypothetical protein RHSIM_Rhsim04G0158200 [Rhododendron simsii]|uniref:Uncharacterized protein n=1 Tax=Rhododendron simsii TaxID=118357 RepID=A0A834H359_RHOSS|nr:hypothetical protein RHSIM_Rhsim04G0158200 [Rhododendron simsii]
MQIESLTTEKGQLQKYLSTTEQRQKAIIVQKDAKICSLTNKLSFTSKLSVQPQKHLPVVETDSSLLTQGREKSEGDNKDDNAKQRPRRQKMDDNYYYGSITKDGRKKEQIVIVESDEPQAETKKLDDKIPPLEKKASIVLALLPDKCQETIRKFWELEEGCTHIWDCEFDDLRIYQEDVRFLLCDRELIGQNAPNDTPPNNAPKISPMEDAMKKIIKEHVAPLKAEVERLRHEHRIQSIDLTRLRIEIQTLMEAHREEGAEEKEEDA